MQQKDTNIFLQSLRGNQPMIVLAFLLIRTALTIEDLEAATGLHNDTVRAAVKGLASKDMLFKQTGEHGRVTWLPRGDTFFGRIMHQSPKSSDSGDDDVVVVMVEEKNLLSTSTSIMAQSPKTSDSGLTADDRACQAALADAGIRGKKAKSLIKLPWVTLEYIKAHHQWVQTVPWDNPAGMMVYRIEGEEPAPDASELVFKKEDNRHLFDDLLRERAEHNDELHDDDCDCIVCQQKFPDRYCGYQTEIFSSGVRKPTLSGPCRARKAAGYSYCDGHLKFERSTE